MVLHRDEHLLVADKPHFLPVVPTGRYLQESLLVKDGVGFAYNDSCFTYLMTYSQSRDLNTREVTQSIGFNLSFRTLGDFGSSTNAVDTIQ